MGGDAGREMTATRERHTDTQTFTTDTPPAEAATHPEWAYRHTDTQTHIHTHSQPTLRQLRLPHTPSERTDTQTHEARGQLTLPPPQPATAGRLETSRVGGA